MTRFNRWNARWRRGLVAVVAITALGAPAAQVSAQPRAESMARSTRAATKSQTDSVFRLYRAYFLRDPEPGGLKYWSDQFSSGAMSLEQISQFFAKSSEFKRRYGSLSDAQFVRLVYQNVLGRSPDSSGESYWVRRMHLGANRGLIMVGFSESPEFQRSTGTSAPTKPTPPKPPATPGWATQVLNLVNKERAAHGLQPLRLCATLTRAAQGHSNDQVANGMQGHTGSDGSNPGTRIARAGYGTNVYWGENVAFGFTDIAAVVKAWLASAAHRQNLLSANFQHIGLGRTASAQGYHWTQDFGGGGTC